MSHATVTFTLAVVLGILIILMAADAIVHRVRQIRRIRHAKRMVRLHLPEALRGDPLSRKQVEDFSIWLRARRK